MSAVQQLHSQMAGRKAVSASRAGAAATHPRCTAAARPNLRPGRANYAARFHITCSASSESSSSSADLPPGWGPRSAPGSSSSGPAQHAPSATARSGATAPAPSSAAKPAAAAAAAADPSAQQHKGKRVVVVGAGWGGFGAALALAKAGARVTLLDASDSPGGLSSAFVTPGVCGFGVVLAWF